MRATRAALESALALVSMATAARSTTNALKHVLIEHDGDSCRFTATDVFTTISAPISCTPGAPFSTLAPASRLLGLVRSIDGAEVEMHVTASNRLQVSSDNHKSEMPCMFREEFPRGKEENLVPLGKIPSGDLLALLRSCSFCAEPGKPPEAIQVSVNGTEIAVASTNHSNAALGIGRLPEAAEGEPRSFLVDTWSEPKFEAFIQATDSITLSIGRSNLRIDEAGGRWMLVRLLDAEFPGRLHPIMRGFLGNQDGFVTSAKFLREEALSAMKRLMMFSDASGVTDLFVTFSETLSMTTGNADKGRAAETIPSAVVSGEKTSTILSAPRIYQGLKHTKGEHVRLGLSRGDDSSPAVMMNCDEGFAEWVFLSSRVYDRAKDRHAT